MLKQVHLYIKGDVICVGFRSWVKIHAKIFGVTGWVRNVNNHPDIYGPGGGVEAQIQGEEEEVKQIIELIKKGPPASHVAGVEIFWQEPKEVFDEFKMVK